MIVSTTLAGPGAEHSITDALRSIVDSVDYCLVAFAGCDEPATRAAIEAVVPGAKLITCNHDWKSAYDRGGYGANRQFMLDWATSFGSSWAITVDTDERVELKPGFQAKLLAGEHLDVWIIRDRDEGYTKERILACGRGLKWHGRVCENVVTQKPQAMLDGCFWEVKKDEAAERRRYERGIVETQRMIAEGDDRFKWWRHMGSCLVGVGKMAEGKAAYENALQREHGPEDEAWTTYLICELLVLEGKLTEARDLAAKALPKHGGFIPEFGWIFAYTEFHEGDLQNASRWAQLASTCPRDKTRIGHRGKNCINGSRHLLQILTSTERPPAVDMHGVRVPVTERFSDNMIKVMLAGRYEETEAVMLEGLLRADDRVLDLGAGCGFLSTLAAKRLAPGAVMAVEADPDLVAACTETFKANEVEVTLLNAAVAEREEPVQLTRTKDFWSNKLGAEAGEFTVEVQGIRFGDLCNAHKPTVVVCDIEGAELHLCDSALAEHVRAVLIEVHSEGLKQDVEAWMARNSFGRVRAAERTMLFERLSG